jgi:tetratricopeptide (TPR) repeat protein
VSNRCPRPLAAFATIVYLTIPCVTLFVTPVRSQPFDVSLLRGELHSESAVNFRDYRVELEDVTHHADIYRADVAIDGAFEFRHLPAGEFLLRVTALNGDIIHQEFVPVNSHAAQLDVRLRTGRKPSAPGTISVTQLRHPPDRKAIQAFAAAQRLAASSPEKAAEELEKAVRISPEFADAYTSLAVQHIRLRRFQEAVGELTRAIEIAGPNPLRLSNLAYAQINLSRVAESIGSVRAALRLDAGYPPAHLILGSILAADPRTRAEAIPHLEQAAESIPAARVMLEKLQAAR